jgi:hypothetical protein
MTVIPTIYGELHPPIRVNRDHGQARANAAFDAPLAQG